MGERTTISWTDATWSPIRARVRQDAREIARAKGYTSLLPIIKPGRVGPHCEHVSPGCKLCYSGTNTRDLVEMFVDGRMLEQPLHWKRPRKIFVENQSDLFGEFVPDEFIDRVFAVMALCPQHTFQVLTKRADRAFEYFYRKPVPGYGPDWYEFNGAHGRVHSAMVEMFPKIPGSILNAASDYIERQFPGGDGFIRQWPLPNVWLGVSAEDQQRADERIPLLLETPAAVRFVSYEPALGPVDFTPWLDRLSWIICGGESGHGARPMNPQWARDVRDQCAQAGVPFFFKQNGAWVSVSEVTGSGPHHHFEDGRTVRRVGTKKAGRLLDGVEHNGFPEVRAC